MTVREFINSFSEKELDKELVFNFSLTYMVKPTDIHYTAEEFNDMWEYELEEEYYSKDEIKKDNVVVVECK